MDTILAYHDESVKQGLCLISVELTGFEIALDICVKFAYTKPLDQLNVFAKYYNL